MFACGGIFLAAAFSLARVVLADVLVQPGYHYDNNRHNPSHQPAVPRHQSLLPTEQYYMRQLTDQQLMPHLKKVQAVYPYDGYQDYYRSNLVGYPAYRHHSYILPYHLHYSKIGGHGYTRPSIYATYSHPVIGHHRFKRSSVHDITVEELAKPALVNSDKVATKPSLMDTKYSTVIDSHLQENEPVGTDNKRSEGKRQSNDDHTITRPSLFGLYPENMYRGSRQLSAISNLAKLSDISTRSSAGSGKSTANLATTVVVNPVQEMTTATSQGTKLGKDNKNQQQNQTPLTDPKQPSSPTSISSSDKASDEELVGAARNIYYDYGKEFAWPIVSPGIYSAPLQYETWNLPSLYNPIYVRNFPDPRASYASSKFEPRHQQNAYQIPNKKSSLKSRSKFNKERLRTDQLIGASNPNSDIRAMPFCNTPDYPEYSPIYDFVPAEPIEYPVDPDYYTAYKSYLTGAIQNNPTTDVVQTSPYTSQLSSIYDNPVTTRYVTLPQTYYDISPTLTYGSAPFEDTFSSSTYY